MHHRITHTNHCKFYCKFSNLLRKLARSPVVLAERAFAVPDAHARRYGWQVTSARGGFGREYRDLRFDTLTACTDCRGRGITTTRSSCQSCSGTGRITIKSAADPQSGPTGRELT